MVRTARACWPSGRAPVVDQPELTDLTLPTEWIQTCFTCSHAMFGERGTYCPVYNEHVLSERDAGEDCPSFVSADGKTYINLDPDREEDA